MGLTQSERRLVENETIFRKHTENVQRDIDAVNKVAAEEGAAPMDIDGSTALYFNCECSDENCRKRIRISPDAYKRVHTDRRSFAIMCGHDVPGVEEVTKVEKEYCVVTKNKPVPKPAQKLNKTDIDNR